MRLLIFFIFFADIVSSCVYPITQRQSAGDIEPVHQNILLLDPAIDRFAEKGPFAVLERLNKELSLNLDEVVVLDHFAPITTDKAPVVVISHGNFSAKAAHRDQAIRLASWGFHVLSFEVPNRDQWLGNGRRLARILGLIHRSPELLGEKVDGEKLIVVGHSFGGSASVLAIAEGAPVVGAVLLDPAVVHSRVVSAMQGVNVPVVLLGSDQKLFLARGRSKFFKNISGEMLEVTVTGAVHDDAQGPSMFSRSSLGVDPFTSRDNQKYFRSMLTVAVIGLSSSGTLDFPSRLYKREQESGRLKGVAYRARHQSSR